MHKKLKVAVLMGGNSSEYDISLISGKEVLRNLSDKYIGVPIVVAKDGNEWLNNLLREKPDICFIAMHGLFGEDGKIQGMLDILKIKYTGSGVLASAVGMDKILFRKIMQAEGIVVPKLTSKFPCFVKPHNQGSSVGASIVRSKKDLKKAIKLVKKYSRQVIIEEYLKGTEVTCAVLGNEKPIALPVIEIIPLKGEFFDYVSKYTESGSKEIVPARISQALTREVQDLAIRVYKAVGCRGFGRVDFILKDNKYPIVLEINTIPGLTPMSLVPKAAKTYGLSYSELLDKIIKYSIYE
ncbi:hypothetical protein A2192_01305 [Candidatus Nomurabacteria bacterium RIFOXYA1_FULL_35_17]|uniref:D-alanine--D-alanine ligase n=1 Tax=Candidatus Nomurabacteria bacterium RIFOXYA1_FULL_35_17 TaxID=1801798 RepID=A0A1F6YJJ9_9BACT|nr:MAG: hypothetical protein A2192_01305 [Candidatus Nomurabacteria bacterium RIFOXYA1_FULL_35_17]